MEAARSICVAGDFTKYDEHAVSQINRNTELVRYRRYGEEFMVFELVNSSTGTALELTPRSQGQAGQRELS